MNGRFRKCSPVEGVSEVSRALNVVTENLGVVALFPEDSFKTTVSRHELQCDWTA